MIEDEMANGIVSETVPSNWLTKVNQHETALRELALSAVNNCTAINKEKAFHRMPVLDGSWAFSFGNSSCIKYAP